MAVSLRYRQIHLDFHTSPVCENIGEHFDANSFVQRLKDGYVDSVNIFAKCHHGMSYYPSKVGIVHPHLRYDLLGEQIEALHQADIKCPVYLSIMWDDWAAQEHPEWIIFDRDGHASIRPPLSGEWGWSTLDVGSGYGDYLLAQAEEICENYDIDGMFFDITWPRPNYSPWGMKRMADAGVNASDEKQVQAFATQVLADFYERMTACVRDKAPDATIYYNGTTTPSMRWTLPYMTHLEIESLPTSGLWGYLHYPMFARQARTYGLPFVGMTGRFHKSWADFGGLKTRDQLDYECGVILAAGGAVCVGDQLHPSGKLDDAVYRLTAHSFQRVKALEPWTKGAVPTAELAIQLLDRDRLYPPCPGHEHGYPSAVEGAAQMLLESAIQFDIVDPDGAIDQYDVIILADQGSIDTALAQKLRQYLSQGGQLLVSGVAALCNGNFVLDEIPVTYQQASPTIPSFVRPDPLLTRGNELADDYDYVIYNRSHVVSPAAGSETFGMLSRALFNRTYEHYISHQHAPAGESLNAPFAVQKGPIAYIASEIFSAYRDHDYWAYRELALAVLKRLLPHPLLIVNGPGWVEGNLHLQTANEEHPARRIVHLSAYHPRRSMQAIPHADQSWSTSDLSIRVRLDNDRPEQAYLAPDKTSLPLKRIDGYAEITLPPIGAHAVIVIE
ncbi:hypothetical protein CSB45_01925 [candidate division KSB3 bacterium]|uniref:Beta-galactosidase trimerisation domain-containing protein n=1 Tax=candidate division KSB3 bacterium TaxID=2044937 RepID=A0A2G6EAI2_9BACT|nr:MAG: hypothetical protein CSB45_01925 [candidate division KSB3 bacterium]PIE30842.1 MAG: hypothetical protein CSA57_00535 [candidate division KSB3 bacterium]